VVGRTEAVRAASDGLPPRATRVTNDGCAPHPGGAATIRDYDATALPKSPDTADVHPGQLSITAGSHVGGALALPRKT